MLKTSVTGSTTSSDEMAAAAKLVLPPLQPPASVSICSLDSCSLLLLLLLPPDDADDDVAELLFPVDVFRGFSCGACLAYSTFSSCKILCRTVSIWSSQLTHSWGKAAVRERGTSNDKWYSSKYGHGLTSLYEMYTTQSINSFVGTGTVRQRGQYVLSNDQWYSSQRDTKPSED